jgi:hypothetical protein
MKHIEFEMNTSLKQCYFNIGSEMQEENKLSSS